MYSLCEYEFSSFAVCLYHRHAPSHRTDALLEGYGYNTLSEMQFVEKLHASCTADDNIQQPRRLATVSITFSARSAQ